jgi:hypothetical protein
MPHLSDADKTFFKGNGYLVKHDALSADQISAAQNAIWEGLDADRNDPQTWINAGPRTPVPSSHPAIGATMQESPIFAMAEELVGKNQLKSSNPGPNLVFPCGDDEWSLPQHGHLDGYYTPTNGVPEGTVGSFHVGATIYVEHIEPHGAGFTVWPGSHKIAHEFFKTHSLLSIKGGTSQTLFAGLDNPPRAMEVTGPPGTVCFWHGQMVHSGSKNCARNIRMALIARLARKDLNDIRFASPDDMWTYWEGIN